MNQFLSFRKFVSKGKWLVVLAIAAYMIKNIFVGLSTDEEYGIILGYRLARGDRLFDQMWEPHQTSGIFIALFMRIFLFLSGGSFTGVVIFLRFVYFGIQILIAIAVYRILCAYFKEVLPHTYAIILALLYFITAPKHIYIPEYSNLHIWFSTIAALCIIVAFRGQTENRTKHLRWLALGSLFLVFDVLSYPSMVILYLGCLLFVLTYDKSPIWQKSLAFLLPPICCAVLVMSYLFSYVTPQQLIEALHQVLSDGSHAISLSGKLEIVGSVFLGMIGNAILCAIPAALAGFLLLRRRRPAPSKQDSIILYGFMWYFCLLLNQCYHWLTDAVIPAYPLLPYLLIPIIGLVLSRRDKKHPPMSIFLILYAYISYFCVLLLSNWEPNHLNSYLILGVIGSICVIAPYCRQALYGYGKKLLWISLFLLAASNGLAQTILISGGDGNNRTLFQVRGVDKSGYAIGIFGTYMSAYKYNRMARDWQQMAPDHSCVLYVGPSQSFYMLGDNIISTPNTISTPVYDDNLLTFWQQHPDRYPDVVIVDSWFGNITLWDDPAYGYMKEWLEEEYHPSSIEQFDYAMVYRK